VSALDQVAFDLEPRDAETPLPFSFMDLNAVPVGAGLGLLYDSDPVTIEGLGDDGSAQIRINDGQYSTDGGATFTSATGIVSNGDNVIVRLTGPAGTNGAGQPVGATLTVGNYN